MTTAPYVTRCAQLRALLAAGEDGERVAQAVADHVASCPTCAADDRSLSDLLRCYCRSEPSALAGDLEARLLDRLCHS
jgi:hypothetical protein